MSRTAAVVVSAVVLVAAGVGAGVLVFLRAPAVSGEDVGQATALRPVQTQLAALPACGLRYRTHNRYPVHQVILESCDAPASHVWLDAPAGWHFEDVRFEAKRDRVADRWQIFVDQDRVPLEQLVAALTALAPMLTAQGAAALAKAHDADAAFAHGAGDRERAEQDRRDHARRSYDPQ